MTATKVAFARMERDRFLGTNRPCRGERLCSRCGIDLPPKRDSDQCMDCQTVEALIRKNERRRSTRELEPCGTPAAALRHIRNGEDVCPPCAAARSAKQREEYARKKLRKPVDRLLGIAID